MSTIAAETKRINRSLMVGWTIIVLVLFVSYIGEYIKGTRTLGYVVVFLLCTILPNLFCHILYHRNPQSENMRYYIVVGYFVMYTFSVLTGSTFMVFSYILPLLSLLILYHQPMLIFWTGVVAVIVNIYSIVRLLLSGALNLESSKDVEIQLALIFLCFGGCYAATRIYDKIYQQNLQFMEELETQNTQTRQFTMQTIMTIANTIDAKDEYTKGHSQRVSEYSAALAEALGMSEEDVERIRYIALLHDIGKIGVPDAILNKPGRLTDTEFAVMKQHTVAGGDILRDINSVKDLDVGTKYHHERYDGKGYPEGLAGDEIPYVARIIGIADAYDAMTSNRVYRKRLSDEEVWAEVGRCSGTQFDPNMAEVFLRLVKEGKLQSISTDTYNAQDSTQETPAGQLLQKLVEGFKANYDEKMQKDNLTGVHARAFGEQMLSTYLEEGGDGCLLSVDMDALRNVNNLHGFLLGDLYLNTVANTLNNLYKNKILYRNSGDEFICFLYGVTKKDVVKRELERLMEAVKRAKTEDDELENLSISVGALIVNSGEFSREEAMNRVGRALYFAKQKGGGGVIMYHELDIDFQPRLSHSDLNNLLRTIRKQGSYSKVYEVNYPEFAKMLNYLEHLAERNEQQMQIILFTLLAVDEESVTVEEKTEAMKTLEDAVMSSLRKVDVTMPFSSSQRLVVLVNTSEEYIQLVSNRIISAFYKHSFNKKFSLNYDVADLNADENEDENNNS